MQKNGNGGSRRNSQHRSRTPEKPLLTVPDVANWFQVSEAQIYDLLHRGAIPGVQVDGVWRFSRDKLERWVLDAIWTR
jgi:excisionase family DNA binding protein